MRFDFALFCYQSHTQNDYYISSNLSTCLFRRNRIEFFPAVRTSFFARKSLVCDARSVATYLSRLCRPLRLHQFARDLRQPLLHRVRVRVPVRRHRGSPRRHQPEQEQPCHHSSTQLLLRRRLHRRCRISINTASRRQYRLPRWRVHHCSLRNHRAKAAAAACRIMAVARVCDEATVVAAAALAVSL